MKNEKRGHGLDDTKSPEELLEKMRENYIAASDLDGVLEQLRGVEKLWREAREKNLADPADARYAEVPYLEGLKAIVDNSESIPEDRKQEVLDTLDSFRKVSDDAKGDEIIKYIREKLGQ